MSKRDWLELVAVVFAGLSLVQAAHAVADYIILPMRYGIYK